MTVSFEPGYVLPSGDLPLKNARILHDGNMFRVKTISASSELPFYPALAANLGNTVDRWRPFNNEAPSPSNFSNDDWTPTEITVGSDGRTLSETAATGEHKVSAEYTFTAAEHVLAFDVDPQTMPEVQARADDGTTSFTCFFDLRGNTLGTEANCNGKIIQNSDGSVRLLIVFTPIAATGVIELLGSNGSETISYAGSTSNTVKIKQAIVHESTATLTYDLFSAQEGDTFAIAAHNLWSGGATLTVQHDSNDDDTWTTIGSVTPTDNSPVMFIYEPITSAKWRIQINGGALPEIGVFRVGKSLQMERPFYSGFSPSSMNQNVDLLGNISGSGQLLGQVAEFSTLNASYKWEHLTYGWVLENLAGPDGLVNRSRGKPVFAAWRPLDDQNVDYIFSPKVSAPVAMGVLDYYTFGMSGEALAYE